MGSSLTEFPKLVLGIYPSLVRESHAWVGRLLSALEGVAPSRDVENMMSKQKKQEDTAEIPGDILKIPQSPSPQGSKQKKASTSKRSGKTFSKKSRKSSRKKASKDKSTQEVLAKPAKHIQFTLWDIGLG